MAALSRLQSSTCSNPVLDLFTQASGQLVDVYEVSFQIFDRTAGAPGAQVFPPVSGDRAVVEVDEDCPDGDRLGVGHYVARWTVPSNANLGTYFIKWYMRLSNSAPEQTFVEEFEVLAEVVGSANQENNYCLIQDIRDEGFAVDQFSDTVVQSRIVLASRLIEAATKRFFYPRLMTIRLDGRGGPKLLLDDPIIAIEYVRHDISPLYIDDDGYLLESGDYRVYNRHLTQNLTSPDDRNSPKIEMVHIHRSGHGRIGFAKGQQNVEIRGYFGYTDYDGTPKGKTPDLIKHACKLLVRRAIEPLSSNAPDPTRVTSERTRDQAVTYAQLTPGQRGAFFSGDPEIDNILAFYQRPPAMGAV